MRLFPLSRSFLLSLIPGSLLLLGGCEMIFPPPIIQGATIEKADYSRLTPGKSTKKEALDIIGSPTIHATFNDNVWIYVALSTSPVPMSYPSLDQQKVLVLAFDDAGVLRDRRLLTKKDASPVHMVSDSTPTPGTKISIMQELMGAVGRYNPMSGMSSAFGGMGGMGGMNNGGGLGGGPMSGQGTGNGGTGNTLP